MSFDAFGVILKYSKVASNVSGAVHCQRRGTNIKECSKETHSIMVGWCGHKVGRDCVLVHSVVACTRAQWHDRSCFDIKKSNSIYTL